MARLSNEVIAEEVDKLRLLVKSGEILKYSERDLEKQVKFTRNTLRKHLREIKEEIGTRDIQVISIRLMNILDTMMLDIEKFWEKAREEGDEAKVIYYTKQMFFAIEKFTDFLERFGIKDKVAEKMDIQADITQRSLNIEVVTTKPIENGSD